MIAEEWVAPRGSDDRGLVISEYPQPAQDREPIAIAGVGVIAGETAGLPGFVRRLLAARDATGTKSSEVVLPMKNLGFPPNDLQESLAQQTSILAVVEEALRQVGGLNPDRTGVYIGMCVDPQAARHGLRVRLHEILSDDVDVAGWRQVNTRSARHLTAAGVIGCMPNIPANRVHAQQDWRAPGFTVASEELSGVDALKLAARALQAREIDCALVGASDFSHESAHVDAAIRVLPEDRHRPGDAAVGLVVMREQDAIDKGYPIFASIVEGGEVSGAAPVSLSLVPEEGESEVTARFGHAHGASGLLHIASGAVMAQLGVMLDAEGAWPAPRRKDTAHTHVSIRSFMGLEGEVFLRAPDRTTDLISPVDVPLTQFFASGTLSDLGSAVLAGRQSSEGEVRVALVGRTEEDIERLAAYAGQELMSGREPNAPGIFFGSGQHDGEVAFCYTGAAAAYPGAGRDLLMAFPEIGHDLTERFAGTPKLASDLYGAEITGFSPATQLTGSSFVCQVHTQFTRAVLGMKPDAAIGLSSGETNSLMAFGVWNDLDAMLAEIDDSEMYVNQLTAECRAAAQYWNLPEGELPEWKNYRIAAPIGVIEEAMESEDRVYVTVIHHYEDIVIGGDAEACDRVVEKVGRSRAIDLGLDMVVHCAPLTPFEKRWHDIHLRDTSSVPGVRFYTNAWNSAYVPTRESAAEAITRQAIDPVDFPKTLEAAYDDGVRVFVEHGPRAILTNAIGRILGDRPHLVVALDPHEGSGLEALTRSVACLWAAGVPMDLTQFLSRIAGLRSGGESAVEPEGPVLRLPAHSPDVVWPKSFMRPNSRNTLVKTMEVSNPDENVMIPPPTNGFDYDVGRHFVDVEAVPRAVASVERPIPSVPKDSVAVVDPALDLFNAVAQAHTDFLKEQKETHDAFLAMGLGPTTGLPASVSVETEVPPDLRVVVQPTGEPSTHVKRKEVAQRGSSLGISDSGEGAEVVLESSEKRSGPPSPVI
ncbi:MAG TPA: hypothetical protein DG084_00750, partial [Gemmatimonadetes bacterium]|nr:hypothetical protein [Gemmatimonadota bacterium]